MEPAVVLIEAVVEETQGGAGPVDRLRSRNPPALRGDAETGQAEPGGGDAGHVATAFVVRRAVGPAPVTDEARPWIGLDPEEVERPPGQVLEESLVGRGERDARRRRRGGSGWTRGRARGPRCQDQHRGGEDSRDAQGATTSNEPSSPPSELVPRRTRKRPGSTTHLISRS